MGRGSFLTMACGVSVQVAISCRPSHRPSWKFLVCLAVGVLAGCDSVEDSPPETSWFVNVADESGISFQFISGYKNRPLLPEIVGGGVAIADFNRDGLLDLYFLQGGFNLDTGMALEGEEIPPNELYINHGSMTFVRKKNIGDAIDPSYSMGASAGDFDNDGDIDLYVTNLGPNKLLENDGHGFFTDVTGHAGVGDPNWGTAAAFVDFDVDGHLDLFVSNYIDWSPSAELNCFSQGQPTYCLPTSYQAEARDVLYRNLGNGIFEDVSVAAGLAAAYGPGLGLVAADFDGSNGLDVFVANDTMVNQLWLQRAGFTFENMANAWGSAVDDHGFPKAGMGIDTADVDRDGDFDVVVVNFEGQTDSFHQNESTYFLDVTSRAGLGVGSRRFTRFGIVLADFDNDGVTDMYQANGKVDGVAASTDDPFAEPNMLFQGSLADNNIRFQIVEALENTNSEPLHTSRGVAVADLDRDGGLDLVVVNRDAPIYLLKNTVDERGNWFRVRPLLGSKQPAIGAVVTLTTIGETQTGISKTSGSYLASNDASVHFGLNQATSVQNVSIKWLDGSIESIGPFDPNQEIVVIKGEEGHSSEVRSATVTN